MQLIYKTKKMNHPMSKGRYQSKLILGVLLFSFSVGSFLVVSPPSAEAQAAPVSNPCRIKIARQTCESRAKSQCPASGGAAYQKTCAAKQAKKFAPVYTVCRTKENPQSCHSQVKSSCTGKRGAALTTCKNTTSKPLPDRSPTSTDEDGFSLGTGGTVKGTCGEGDDAVDTRFDFGCTGTGSPIVDLAYALIRFLSFGIGLILVASIIYAGIQYSSSEGNAETTQAAKKRIQNAFAGLIFYLFIFALVQFLVPGGLFA